MNCLNCKHEVRDEENQKICYDTCETYKKMKERNELIRRNRREESQFISILVDSTTRSTRKKPVHRTRNYS